jgi:serine/threonine protein kinase
MNAEATPPPTEMFAGKYRLVRMLGKGAMGEVWLAEEEGPRSFRRRVAVKRLLSTTNDAGDIATSSFVAEAQVIAKLDHPNIVRLIELGTFENELYLVLDYVDGAALDRMVKKKTGGGPLSPKAVAYIGREIALALEAVHSLCDEAGNNYGVVHRDVSPSNILISRDGRVRLSDFGVARISAFHGEKTETGIFKGKLPYMPPEQARGQRFDGRADIFSLGVTLFEALVGHRLRRAETQTQLIVLIATERAPRVRTLLPDAPEALAAAIDATLELEPDLRTEDGGRLAADLDAVLKSFGPSAVKEAREELRARVEQVAGPPAQSSTISGGKMSEAGTSGGKRQSWSVPLSPSLSLPTFEDEAGEVGRPSGTDIPSAPTAGLSPQTLRAAGQELASAAGTRGGSARKRPGPLLAIIAVLVGGATAGALMFLKGKSGGAGTPGDTAQANGASTTITSAAPTAAPVTPPAVTGEPAAAGTGEPAGTGATAGQNTPPAPGTTTAAIAPAIPGPTGRLRPPEPTPTASASVDPATPGTLQVIVVPWGDVSVDGKSVGTTPLPAIPLAPGTHTVTVKNAELGASRSLPVTVKPGQPASVKFDLRRTE